MNGYTVLKAENAKDGIRLAGEQKPDLILMDIMLPDMDGLEAVKRLRSVDATNAIKIIVLTSFRDQFSEVEILASGANAFLPKPYHHQDFLNIVLSLLSAEPQT